MTIGLILASPLLHAQAQSQRPAAPQQGSAQAVAERALDGDGRVCDAVFLQSPPGRSGAVLASVDLSGRFCNEIVLIQAGDPPSIRQQIPAWGVDSLSSVLRDVDRNGDVELVVPRLLSDYEGAAACMATTPVVYKCSDVACTDVSDQYGGVYAGELESRRRRLAAVENKGPDEDAREIPCLVMAIDKLQRVLGMNPHAGFEVAEEWMRSADPLVRRRAASVFSDIDDAPSRQRLEVLANDADPRVASAARVFLARQK
jgi:hypothetical protein